MEAVLIKVEKKSDVAFLLGLAQKLGMSAMALTSAEIRDWRFAQKIEAGMKTLKASRDEVMKALGK